MLSTNPPRNLTNYEILESQNRRRQAAERHRADTDANPYLARTNERLAELRARALQQGH